MAENDLPGLSIRASFLGGFEIWVNDCAISGLATQKNRALAAYLILEHERDHPRSKLAALYWPDVDEQAALHNLRQALSVIRKAFEPCSTGEVFSANREGVGFRAGIEFKVDVIEFENQMRGMVDRFHQQPGRGFPITRVKKVLELYRGELLESIMLADASLFSDWLVLRREALNRLAVEGTSLLLKYYETRCEWGEARKTAEKLVRLAPWDENAHSRLIDVLLQLAQGNAALAHYQSAVRYFAEELAIEPEYQMKQSHRDIQRFFESGRCEPRKNFLSLQLPGYSTPFVGRSKELETLEDWASEPGCQVITITGPGGSGKTRLAARLAETQHTLFAGGVFFCSVTGCRDRLQIAASIIDTVNSLGKRSADPLEDLLIWARSRRALLILDNVDDCGEAAFLSTKILDASRHIVIVLTSYSRLNLVGERVFALGGLSTLGGAESEAGRLFLSHVQAESLPEFASADFLGNVVKICQMVEGLPLAIDLAAGQVNSTSSKELLTSLENTLDVLHSSAINLPDRHRSIIASFENCWVHLSQRQQAAISSLTIFRSPFTNQLADEVCGVSPVEIRDLVNQSLLIWDGREHYRFHRVIHQYAHEKLEKTNPEINQLAKRHADQFVLELLHNYENCAGDGFRLFLQKTKDYLPDILAGIKFQIAATNANHLIKPIEALYTYYDGLSLFREGSDDLSELAMSTGSANENNLVRGMLLARVSSLWISSHQYEKAEEALETAMKIARENGNEKELGFCFNVLSKQAVVKKSSSLSVEHAQKALQIAQRMGDKKEEAHSLYNMGYALTNLNEITRAEDVLENCRQICEEIKDWRRLVKVLNVLADTACYRGNFDQALSYYDEAITIANSLGNRYSQSLILNNIGTAYFSIQKYKEAEEAYKKSLELCKEIDDREGEAIAYSNLGELFADLKDFKRGMDYNLKALAICREIDSDWGEVSARVVLALCYREMGQIKAAEDEVVIVLERSLELEFIYFFNRAVVEACRLLLERGKTERIAEVLSFITEDEESDDWVRDRAREVINHLPPGDFQKTIPKNYKDIKEFLVSSLERGLK